MKFPEKVSQRLTVLVSKVLLTSFFSDQGIESQRIKSGITIMRTLRENKTQRKSVVRNHRYAISPYNMTKAETESVNEQSNLNTIAEKPLPNIDVRPQEGERPISVNVPISQNDMGTHMLPTTDVKEGGFVSSDHYINTQTITQPLPPFESMRNAQIAPTESPTIPATRAGYLPSNNNTIPQNRNEQSPHLNYYINDMNNMQQASLNGRNIRTPDNNNNSANIEAPTIPPEDMDLCLQIVTHILDG